jgi:hypothetical protein
MERHGKFVLCGFEVFELWGFFPNNFGVMGDDDLQILGGPNSTKSYYWKNSRKRVLHTQLKRYEAPCFNVFQDF